VLGDLVKEAFGRESVVPVADAAPGCEPRMAQLDDVFGKFVWDRILRYRRALHDDAVDLRRQRAIGDRRIGGHRSSDHTMAPGDKLAGRIEPRFDVMRRHRTELAACHIVLAGPDELDGLADSLGETHRVEDDLMLAATAIAAAEEVLMQRDIG